MLVLTGPRYTVHFGRDSIEERIAVRSFEVDVEVRPTRQKGELRLSSELVECGLKAVGGAVQIEGVIGADEEMNLTLEIGADGAPISLEAFETPLF